MAEVGLLYPILVDSRNVVVDGHRRLAAARELGWETIPAMVIPDGQDTDSLYASVNITAARTTGNDALCVWLENPRAVTSRQAVLFAEMEGALGRAMVEDVAARGWSASIWDIAGRVARYTAHNENDDLKQIVRWFMSAAVMQQVREALRTGIPAKRLWAAVRDMKPLRFVSQSNQE